MTDQLPSGVLKDLLTDYAAQARPYEVREAALRRGRRRRRLNRVGPAVAGLAVLGTVGALAATTRLSGPAPAADPATTTGWPVVGAPTLPALPAVIVDDPDPDPLPADAPVGAGLLVNVIASDGHRLITRSGTQYRLDPAGTTLNAVTYRLSPDGRWLASRPNGAAQTTVRDLTGTAVSNLAGEPLAWSADGSAVLLGGPYPQPRDGSFPPNPGVLTLADLTTAPPTITEVDLSSCARCAVVGIRPDGDLVLDRLDGEVGNLVVADAETSALTNVEFDLTSSATTDQLARAAELELLAGSVTDSTLRLAPDGTVLLRLTETASPPEGTVVDGDILVLGLDTAQVVGRWRMPAQTPAGDNMWHWWGLAAGSFNEGLAGIYAEGLLLTHVVGRPVALELYDPVAGTLTPVTDLSGLTMPVG